MFKQKKSLPGFQLIMFPRGMKIGERIKERRKQLGFSQAALGKLVGVGQTAVAAWEDGRNAPKTPMVEKLARALQTTSAFIQFGERSGLGTKVALRGYVGAGETITSLPDDIVEYIDGPPMVDTPMEALEIRGNSMSPVYRDGDRVFYEKDGHCDPKTQIGEECIVELETGQMLFKQIFNGSKSGLYTLTSYNGQPIQNVKIKVCCPIMWVKRKKRSL